MDGPRARREVGAASPGGHREPALRVTGRREAQANPVLQRLCSLTCHTATHHRRCTQTRSSEHLRMEAEELGLLR